MTRHTRLLIAALCLSTVRAGAADYTVDTNRVVCGDVRFDVLAPDLVRMQFSGQGFVEAPTAVVTNRSLQSDDFQVATDGPWLQLSTPRLTLRYRLGSGRLTSENIRVDFTDARGHHEWTPGVTDEANLGGPVSSFNAIIEDTRPENTLPPFPPGFLSRSGCFLLDDSRTPVWNSDADWIEPRADTRMQDWYLFVYSTDFRAFFSRYTQLTGSVPMVPRYALGAWVTDLNFEYQNQPVTEQSLFDIVDRFRKESIPLDVFVLDFAWHPYGWKGSLDWSPFIPDPKSFLSRMHEAGVRISPNDHPSSGLDTRDSRAASAREALGIPSPESRPWVDTTEGWLLHEDPNNTGLAEGRQGVDFDDSGWREIPSPGPWENQGLQGYDGYAWYRRFAEIPVAFAGKPVHLTFGGVDDEYDLYVNGKFVRHWGAAGESVYDKRTTTEITQYVKAPGRTLIALRVLDWGHNGGILHPSALTPDPRALDDNVRFNLADKLEAEVYMKYHDGLVDQGVDFWWIDGDSARMEGLDGQMWTNRMYYDYQQRHTGQRSFIFSRYGGPGSHRYPGFFTADCFSNWKTLAWEIPYTIKSGNVLVPYVTHDIGGFIGTLRDDFELYARWLQFGALSPLLRLHSAHENPDEGNARLPWAYGTEGVEMARRFFQLRYSLIPYLYTLCREAYDTGMPLCRGLYLEYPDEPEAYRHFDEYLLGHELLVAPITSRAVGGLATRSIWFPPGEWVDWFTSEVYAGGRSIDYTCPLERMPLFVRRGSILPRQPDMPHTGAAPVDPLILDVYPGQNASFTLYEDDGLSLDYTEGKCRRTPLQLSQHQGSWELSIGPAEGQYTGMQARSGYELRIHAEGPPRQLSVDGTTREATWDAEARVATLPIKLPADADPARPILVRASQ